MDADLRPAIAIQDVHTWLKQWALSRLVWPQWWIFKNKGLLMSFNAFWCLTMPYDAFWFRSMPFDAFRCLPMPFDAFWCLLMPFDAFWCLSMPFDVFWCLSMPFDAFRCLSMPFDAFRCLSMPFNVFGVNHTNYLVLNGGLWCCTFQPNLTLGFIIYPPLFGFCYALKWNYDLWTKAHSLTTKNVKLQDSWTSWTRDLQQAKYLITWLWHVSILVVVSV